MTDPVNPNQDEARRVRHRVRVIAGSIGGHTKWAKCADRTAATANARKAFLDRFDREVDPLGELSPTELARRSANARAAFYKRLALRSAQARRRKAAP